MLGRVIVLARLAKMLMASATQECKKDRKALVCLRPTSSQQGGRWLETKCTDAVNRKRGVREEPPVFLGEAESRGEQKPCNGVSRQDQRACRTSRE